MFEQQSSPPIQPREEKPTPTTTPLPQQAVLSQEAAQREIIEEDKLSILQKLVLVFVALVVIGTLVGGGIWIYSNLTDEEMKSSNTNTATTNTPSLTNVENRNTNALSDDQDNDGLKTAQETIYGTDPNNPDSDGDGYSDGEEIKHGYNPKGPGRL